jgi:hypothetical protein
MSFSDDLISRLAAADSFGYHAGTPDSTEPVALSAMALLASDNAKRATPLLDWLLARQATDGSLGIDAVDDTPGWPTGWAIIAWQLAEATPASAVRYVQAKQRALNWLFQVQGQIIERVDLAGHDTLIKGWPWVEGTHAWAEPTAMNLLALKHTGHDSHPRAREAVRLLHDRLLRGGGCNYGNTIVFGQELRPQLEPTGVCLLALMGETDDDGRTAKAIEYVQRELSANTTTASLSYGLLGLAAQDAYPPAANDWLAAAAERTIARDPAPYKLALLTLASLGNASPLIPATHQAIAR